MSWAAEVERESAMMAERELAAEVSALLHFAEAELGVPVTLHQVVRDRLLLSLELQAPGGVDILLTAVGRDLPTTLAALRRLVLNQSVAGRV